MGKKFILEGNIMTDMSTGSVKLFPEGQKKHYAVIAKAGHCGKGKYTPILIDVSATSKELAMEICRKMPRVKSSRSNAIIDIMEISETERNYVAYLNKCDRFMHMNSHSQDDMSVLDRTIVMEEAVDFENSGKRGMFQAETVKTADKYSNVHVLQRYLAPRYEGDRLVYPKNINFRAMLDEHFYYSTLQLGIFMRKASPLSFYYQIYGDHNGLGVKYSNGKIHFNDGPERVFISAPAEMIPYLEKAKQQFKEERKIRLEKEAQEQISLEKSQKKKKSATEKFNARYEKYQQIKNSNIPTK